jgi:hypothetical protein
MAKKKPPATIHDDVLGEVRFACHVSPKLDNYTAETKVARRSVEFDLYTDDKLDIMPRIELAKQIVKNYADIAKDARAFFTKKVLPLYNSTWRRPSAPKGTALLFDKIKLFQIILSDSGITFVYDPGKMFEDHLLWLTADQKLRFVDFDIPG